LRKSILLLASTALALLLACGVALAAEITCPNRSGNLCVGTADEDTMTGRDTTDVMRVRGGNDTMRALAEIDTLSGQRGDDILSGGEGDDTYVVVDQGGSDRIPEGGESGGDGHHRLLRCC
jgi:hypothetical protein